MAWLASSALRFDFADAVRQGAEPGDGRKRAGAGAIRRSGALMGWAKALFDLIIGRHFNAPDLEFRWDQRNSPVDPLVQAQIHQIYVQRQDQTADEVRAELGRNPLTAEQKSELPAAAAHVARHKPATAKPAKEALAKAKSLFRLLTGIAESIARKQKEIQQVVAEFSPAQAKDVAKQVIDLRGRVFRRRRQATSAGKRSS